MPRWPDPATRKRRGRGRRIWAAQFFVATLGLWGFLGSVSVAGHPPQDDVVVRQADGSEVTRSGLVLKYDANQLLLRSGERELTIAADRVVEVRSAWDRLALPGEQLLAARKFSEAYAAFGRELQTAAPEWFRQRLMVGQVRAARESGQWLAAIAAYRELRQADRQSRYAAELPLAWVSGRPDAALERTATELMTREQPWERLLGASQCLAGTNRKAAVDALQQLTRDLEPLIAQLARSQLWRLEVQAPARDVLESREQEIRRLPLACQAGPWWLIGNQWASIDHERSALALLRVPILCSEQVGLAARANLAAADQLQLAGDSAAAHALWREVQQQFAGTPEASVAAERLKK